MEQSRLGRDQEGPLEQADSGWVKGMGWGSLGAGVMLGVILGVWACMAQTGCCSSLHVYDEAAF